MASKIHNTEGYLTAYLSQRGFLDTQRLKVRLDALAPLPGSVLCSMPSPADPTFMREAA